MLLAAQLGQDVFAQQIAHADSSVASVASVVTVSLGVCSTHPSAASGAAELLRRADAYLYQAKAAGRHTVRGGELSAG